MAAAKLIASDPLGLSEIFWCGISFLEPADGRTKIVIEDAVVSLAEGNARQVCNASVGHDDGPAKAYGWVSLRFELLLHKRGIDSREFQFEGVIEDAGLASVLDEAQHALLACPKQWLGGYTADAREDDAAARLDP